MKESIKKFAEQKKMMLFIGEKFVSSKRKFTKEQRDEMSRCILEVKKMFTYEDWMKHNDIQLLNSVYQKTMSAIKQRGEK